MRIASGPACGREADKNVDGPNDEVIGQEKDGRRAPKQGRERWMGLRKKGCAPAEQGKKKSKDSTGN